jgi:hypothetical protein
LALQLIADAALLSSLFSGTDRAPGAFALYIYRLAAKGMPRFALEGKLRRVVDILVA